MKPTQARDQAVGFPAVSLCFESKAPESFSIANLPRLSALDVWVMLINTALAKQKLTLKRHALFQSSQGTAPAVLFDQEIRPLFHNFLHEHSQLLVQDGNTIGRDMDSSFCLFYLLFSTKKIKGRMPAHFVFSFYISILHRISTLLSK